MFSNNFECRKVRKPKIEKLRRARINSSLESLKEILLRNTISIPQGSRPTKLEKADILEMTVRYIEMLHEKLSISSGKMPKKIEEKNEWNSREAFGEIKNLMSIRHLQNGKKESKVCVGNLKNLKNSFDKENVCFVKVKKENESKLEENHWRPW